MPKQIYLAMVPILTLLQGCEQPSFPATPMCRVEQTLEPVETPSAGCLVITNDKILVIKHKFTGKLDLPGGKTNLNEVSACTAHRETWEETGFNVKVLSVAKQFDNGYRLHLCQLENEIDENWDEIPAPAWSKNEVDGLLFVDPYQTDYKDWRFPDELPLLRRLYDARVSQNK